MLLAYLLNQVMDELGRELRQHSENVRASLNAILFLAEEQLPLQSPPPQAGTGDVPAPAP